MKSKLFSMAFITLLLVFTLSFLNVNAESEVIKGGLTASCGIMPFGGEEVGSFEMTINKIGDRKHIDSLVVDMNKHPENGTYDVGFSSHGPNLLNESMMDIDEYRSGGKVMIVKDVPLPSPSELLFVKESKGKEHTGATLLLSPKKPVLEPKKVEYRNATIVHTLDVDKQEYTIGEKIDIKPKLVNIGSGSVEIIHRNPLFIITAYTAEGEYAWLDPYGSEDVGHGDILEPLVSYSGREYQMQRYDIRFCSPGEYTLVSYAEFSLGVGGKQVKVYAEPVTIKVDASDSEGWSVVYAVGTFLNSKPPKPDQIFKIQYSIINGTVEEFKVPQHGVGSIVAKVKSSGDGLLEIKFPRNYPYTNEPTGTMVGDILVLINGRDMDYKHDVTECFFSFSIPFTGSSMIELAFPDFLVNTPWHGADIPDRCIPQTVVEDLPVRNDGTIAPLHQFRAGVNAEDIVCKQGFELVIRSDGKPYCAAPSTAKILNELWNK